MMTDIDIENAFQSKRIFFDSGATKSYAFRLEHLKRFKDSIKEHEAEIIEALYLDFHKPALESFISEIGIMYDELNCMIENLKAWMQPQKLHTPLAIHPSTSRIYVEPLGVVLIIGPWNYPFQLLMAPLAGAIAAGNCAIIKPSENTKHIGFVIKKMVAKLFPPNYISVIEGSGEIVGPMLIEKFRFDHIFFTGSTGVGKKIMSMAAHHLSPVTLELGGKSPAIVDKKVNIAVAAKRLAWAKCFNAGQTCVCPDYLIVHEAIKEAFIEKFIYYLKEFHGEDPLKSENYTHIVNEKRFNVLVSYLTDDIRIIYGGTYDAITRCIAPTLVDQVPENHPLMNEEIFGPILPILTFKEIKDIVPIIQKNSHPLSCYVFTTNPAIEKFVINTIPFGGGCINNALAHLINPELPFGGVGNSGIGNYHGKYSFDVFSHKKSVLKTKFFLDPSLRYPPYTKLKEKLARFLFK